MKTHDIRKLARRLRCQYYSKEVDYHCLQKYIYEQGFTVVEFYPNDNDEDTTLIIERLDLQDYVSRLQGFTYADNDFRLVFVRADLSEKEKAIILAHEEGHILCGHLECHPLSCSSVVMEEMEKCPMLAFCGVVSGTECMYFFKYRYYCNHITDGLCF